MLLYDSYILCFAQCYTLVTLATSNPSYSLIHTFGSNPPNPLYQGGITHTGCWLLLLLDKGGWEDSNRTLE